MSQLRKFSKLAINGGKPLFKYKNVHFIGSNEKSVVNKIMKTGELSGLKQLLIKIFWRKYVNLLEESLEKV